jgi:Rrf2 family nitric oxide-sensitive transcriptional repressor
VDINIGNVVRSTETDFYMAACFEPDNRDCVYSAGCTLKGVLRSATDAYLAVLDDVTLEDLIKGGPGRAGRNASVKTIRINAQ